MRVTPRIGSGCSTAWAGCGHSTTSSTTRAGSPRRTGATSSSAPGEAWSESTRRSACSPLGHRSRTAERTRTRRRRATRDSRSPGLSPDRRWTRCSQRETVLLRFDQEHDILRKDWTTVDQQIFGKDRHWQGRAGYLTILRDTGRGDYQKAEAALPPLGQLPEPVRTVTRKQRDNWRLGLWWPSNGNDYHSCELPYLSDASLMPSPLRSGRQRPAWRRSGFASRGGSNGRGAAPARGPRTTRRGGCSTATAGSRWLPR